MSRIAFYSHDTVGLGHVRRNLLLAEALTKQVPATTALLICGTHLGAAFQLPPNVDCITLPGLAKTGDDGTYNPRHLAVALTRVRQVRARTTRAALLAFDPDLVVVDNVPRGALGEAEPALAALRTRGRARVVLGLRDVLDEPESVAREWRRSGHHEAIDRYYDQIWVYGDPRICDMVREYGFPATTASKIQYVGYLDRRSTSAAHTNGEELTSLPEHFVLCMTGGGQDGSALALAFARARTSPTPRVLVAGPFLPGDTLNALQALAATDSRLHIVEFSMCAERLMERSDRVVIMGGYNTVCEALAYNKSMLIVPREWPRREQAIRAARLSALDLAEVLPWSDVSPHAIGQWLERPVSPLQTRQLRFTALQRVPELVAELLAPIKTSHFLPARAHYGFAS